MEAFLLSRDALEVMWVSEWLLFLQPGPRTIWHQDNLTPGQFDTADNLTPQTIWHQDNLTPPTKTQQFDTVSGWGIFFSWIYIFVLDIFCQQLGDIWPLEGVCAPFGRWVGKYSLTWIFPCCQIVCGVKLSVFTYGVKLYWCQIVLVSNCLWCQIVRSVQLSWCKIVRGDKLSAVTNCPQCQIVRCVKLSCCQIVR